MKNYLNTKKKTENNKEEQEIKLDKNILSTKNNLGENEPNKAKRKDSKKWSKALTDLRRYISSF